MGDDIIIGSWCDVGAQCVLGIAAAAAGDAKDSDGNGDDVAAAESAQLGDHTRLRPPAAQRSHVSRAGAARQAHLHQMTLQLVAKLLPKSNRLLPANQFHTS